METAMVPRTETAPTTDGLADDMEFADELARAGLPDGDTRTERELRLDYLLEKIRAERQEIQQVEAFTERRVKMIRDHCERETAKHRRRIAWLEDQARKCVPLDAERFQKEYGKKSVNLPHGKVGYRHKSETVEIEDTSKALEWVKENGIDFSVSERVTKTPVLDWIREHGEVPPPESGIELVEGYDDFYVSTD